MCDKNHLRRRKGGPGRYGFGVGALLRDLAAILVTWGLRDYGVDGQLGLEPTPEEYVSRLVDIMREVRQVLRDDGTLWLNLGDSYAGPGKGPSNSETGKTHRRMSNISVDPSRWLSIPSGIKQKDLVGIPWMVAFALRADGWWLRSDIVWAKPNPMPESVTDRPTKAHEYVFLLAKSKHYYFDQEAVRQPHEMTPQRRPTGHARGRSGPLLPEHKWPGTARDEPGVDGNPAGRNIRSVWTIATQPFPGSHFAVSPPKLIEPCIKAGTSEKGCCAECGAPVVREVEHEERETRKHTSDQNKPPMESNTSTLGLSGNGSVEWARRGGKRVTTGWRRSCSCGAGTKPCVVLDPFGGVFTTALVADRLGRNAIMIELNSSYVQIGSERLKSDNSLFCDVSVISPGADAQIRDGGA